MGYDGALTHAALCPETRRFNSIGSDLGVYVCVVINEEKARGCPYNNRLSSDSSLVKVTSDRRDLAGTLLPLASPSGGSAVRGGGVRSPGIFYLSEKCVYSALELLIL